MNTQRVEWRCCCHACGKWFNAGRNDARNCGAACRQLMSRAERGHRSSINRLIAADVTPQRPHHMRSCGCAACVVECKRVGHRVYFNAALEESRAGRDL